MFRTIDTMLRTLWSTVTLDLCTENLFNFISHSYNEKLNEANKLGVKKGFTVGLSFGSIFFIIFIMYGCAFWFGGYLIAEQGAEGGSILGTFFAAIIGAFSFGRAGPDLEALLTAAGSAEEIYKTIDRVCEFL